MNCCNYGMEIPFSITIQHECFVCIFDREIMRFSLLVLSAIAAAFFARETRSQNCSSMNIRHRADIPSTTFEMSMTMREDNTGKPYLYVANKEAGLRIYDITNLEAPSLAKTVPTSLYGGLEVMNVTQEGNYLYLALGNHWSPQSSGMAIVDVSAPANAAVTDYWRTEIDTGGGGMVKVEGNYAYLAAMKNGLIVLDISNKSDIAFVSQFVPDIRYPDPNPDPAKYNARGLEVRNGVVYLCYDAGGIHIINTTDKQNPLETGRFSNPLLNGKPRAYNNLILDDTLLYVTVDYCGLEVLNVADTSNIRLAGWWNPFGCPQNNWLTSAVHANEIAYDPSCKKLFVATGKSDMYVLDISDPTAPDSCNAYGGTENGVGTWGVSIQDDRIYLSYVIAIIPFVSNWTGVKILTYTPCNASVGSEDKAHVKIYPQPAKDAVRIEVQQTLTSRDEVTVTLVNMVGEHVAVPYEFDGANTIVADVSELPAGLYIIQAVADSQLYSAKCLKQ